MNCKPASRFCGLRPAEDPQQADVRMQSDRVCAQLFGVFSERLFEPCPNRGMLVKMFTTLSAALFVLWGQLLLVGELDEPSGADPAVQAPVDGAAEDSDAPMSEADRWMVYQYILGGAEQAPAMLQAVVEGIDDPEKRQEAWPLIGVYAACLATHNKQHLDQWVREAASMSDEFKMTFAYASWYADFEGSPSRLRPLIDSFPKDHSYRRRIEQMLDREPVDFATLPVTSPAVLDFLWGCFLATGETRFVDRIMSVLPPKHQTLDDPEYGDIPTILLAGSARWSLASNAFQHPRVLNHLQERRASEPGPWPELDGIIQEAQDQLAEGPCPAPPEPDRPVQPTDDKAP